MEFQPLVLAAKRVRRRAVRSEDSCYDENVLACKARPQGLPKRAKLLSVIASATDEVSQTSSV